MYSPYVLSGVWMPFIVMKKRRRPSKRQAWTGREPMRGGMTVKFKVLVDMEPCRQLQHESLEKCPRTAENRASDEQGGIA